MLSSNELMNLFASGISVLLLKPIPQCLRDDAEDVGVGMKDRYLLYKLIQA